MLTHPAPTTGIRETIFSLPGRQARRVGVRQCHKLCLSLTKVTDRRGKCRSASAASRLHDGHSQVSGHALAANRAVVVGIDLDVVATDAFPFASDGTSA